MMVKHLLKFLRKIYKLKSSSSNICVLAKTTRLSKLEIWKTKVLIEDIEKSWEVDVDSAALISVINRQGGILKKFLLGMACSGEKIIGWWLAMCLVSGVLSVSGVLGVSGPC